MGFAARFVARERRPGVELLAAAAPRPALVRFSRGVGLPGGLPDVLGIAVRIEHAYGRDRHQDFMLATGAGPPVLRNALLPGANGFLGQTFSSLLPYRFGDELAVVGAAAAPRRAGGGGRLDELAERARVEPIELELRLAGAAGGWRTVAGITLAGRLPDELTESIAFNPWNTGGGIRPAGPLQGLRRPAYAGSQLGRAAAAARG